MRPNIKIAEEAPTVAIKIAAAAHRSLADGRLDVADIGCNAGTQSCIWAERGHVVHGLDINGALLAIARRRALEHGLEIDFREGSATALPWLDASMDVCLLPELLEHVADWESCLTEAARILRPGGVLFVSTTNRLCPRQMEFELPLYAWYPARMKRHYERLAVTTRPELVNHAAFPAVNWFTPYQLRGRLEELGLRAWDHFDWIDIARRSPPVAWSTRRWNSLPDRRRSSGQSSRVRRPSRYSASSRKSPSTRGRSSKAA